MVTSMVMRNPQVRNTGGVEECCLALQLVGKKRPVILIPCGETKLIWLFLVLLSLIS